MARQRLDGWIVGSALMMTVAGAGQAQTGTTPPVQTGVATAPGASVTLGGETVLTLRATAGGMTPQQRVEVIDGRLSDLLGTPNITPADVVVYTPRGKAPVIYTLGRRLITVDAATVKSEGEGKTPLGLATLWAKKLQQTLPRVNWRPSNAPEPVIPANPPLTVTSDLSQVGGNIGLVRLRGKVVFKISGPQTGGMTAQERADMLTKRLQMAAHRLQTAPGGGDVSVSPVSTPKTAAPVPAGADSAPSEQILVAGMPVMTVDKSQAASSGFKSAEQLATAWAKNVRVALGLPATATPTAAATATPSETTAPLASPATVPTPAAAPPASAPPPVAGTAPLPAPAPGS